MKIGLERLLLNYKGTGNEELLKGILLNEDMKQFINGVVRKHNQLNYGLNQKEDLLSIATFRVWKAVEEFKFICPTCGIKALTETAYKSHTVKRHGGYIEPKNTLLVFVKYQIGAYIQNEIRKEYSECRDIGKTSRGVLEAVDSAEPNANHEAKDLVEEMSEMSADFSDNVIIMELVSESMTKLDKTSKEILTYILRNMTNTEIAQIFHDRGDYGSLQSARVSVKRIVDNKIKKQFTWLRELSSVFETKRACLA